MRWYEIDEDRLTDLLEAEIRLTALESGGVDNWSWYSESLWDTKESLANEYGLEIEDLSFRDIARHMIQNGEERKLIS